MRDQLGSLTYSARHPTGSCPQARLAEASKSDMQQTASGHGSTAEEEGSGAGQFQSLGVLNPYAASLSTPRHGDPEDRGNPD